jgi:hypothetical protein
MTRLVLIWVCFGDAAFVDFPFAQASQLIFYLDIPAGASYIWENNLRGI